jgi:ferrous iron transport protein B
MVLSVIDLPGSYSLDPLSPDEELTKQLLLGDDPPAVTIAIVDAAHLARSLYLVAQLREHHMRLVVAVTMSDVAAGRGIDIDPVALQYAIGAPVVIIDPRRRSGVVGLAASVQQVLAAPSVAPRKLPTVAHLPYSERSLILEDDRFAWIEQAVSLSTSDQEAARSDLGDRIDRLVLGSVSGPLIFLFMMWLVFQATTVVASPLQDILDGFFADTLTGWVESVLRALGWDAVWLHGLIVAGFIGGIGSVLTFAPLMTIMFILLALLEDSGYLARAAVITDRMMRRLGLPGQAFLPLIVGFGCNVPGIAATRILPLPRQRLLTALLVPFTSCTARLTVYLMIGDVFFGRWAGTVVFAMYVVSIVLVVATGLLLRATLWRTLPDPPLVLDLPPYQRPTLRLTVSVAWRKLKSFLQSASGIIVAVVIAVWLLQAVPMHGGTFGEVDVADSLYAVIARGIAPVFSLAGFGSWDIASTLLVGFVAKEAVISSWAQTYAVNDPSAGGTIAGMSEALHASFEQTSGGHLLPAVLAFLVFFLAYTPCVATLAAQTREIGAKWTWIGVALQLVVAWVLAVLVFQVGRLL